VSESGFWGWRNRAPSHAAQRRKVLEGYVQRVFDGSNQIYGYRKVHAQLEREGIEVCDRVVRHIMSDLELRSCHPAPWRYLTESDGSDTAPDLMGRDFTASRPGVRFCGDITQIDTWEGPVFLATVIDLYSREVVGWAMDDNYRPGLCRDRDGGP